MFKYHIVSKTFCSLLCGLFELWTVGLMCALIRADPRLLGALCATVSIGGLVRVVINKTHFSVFHSFSNRACGKRSRNMSLPCLAMLSTRCFSLEQETLRHSRYMI